MLARYLQEQPASNSDCGSLLMGFLDFHGNSFDPRATGISVWRRQYFLRSNYDPDVAAYQPVAANQPMWPNGHGHQQHNIVVTMPPVMTPQSNRTDFRRHNSFSETGSVDGNLRQQQRFQPTTTSSFRYNPSRTIPPKPPSSMRLVNTSNATGRVTTVGATTQPGSGTPMFDFTFDPLFVEDPLSASNNVGRNAFRINQIQRVFSDAHRALVASLDWDIHSSAVGGEAGDYPLLKCLLQGEDVLYEL
jgi:Cid1 family poly A polymerase